MKSKHIIFILTIAMGCAVTDFDQSADFYRYKTFAWGESDVKVSNPLYDSDLINDRIRKTVEKEFSRRGIVRSVDNPDFLVQYHTYTEEKQRTSSAYPYGYRFYPYGFIPFGFGWYPAFMVPPYPETRQYTEGTLILDIIDNRTDELIWRGSVSGNVDASALKKQIEKGIRAIMKKYPVSPDDPISVGNEVAIS